MQRESDAGRVLWTLILVVVIGLVIASFAQRPLLGGDGEAAGFTPRVTLWVASANPSDEAERVVQQAASRWDTRTRASSAEVLPGGSVDGVASFLDRIHGNPSDLLVISSTTIADVAHDSALPALSDAGLRARRVAELLHSAPPIAVLSADPLLLAVPRDSPLKDVQALSADTGQSSTPLFSVADDSWETSNLATLVERYGLTGRIPYGVFSSSREAVIDTESGQASVVLAPRSEIRGELRAGKMRQLPWPGDQGAPPETWIAILGATGLSSTQVARLRGEARRLYESPAWRQTLRGDGLSPVSLSTARLRDFVQGNLGQATRLQNIAARVVHED
jgi:putative tricarboxylic transport membrane protein